MNLVPPSNPHALPSGVPAPNAVLFAPTVSQADIDMVTSSIFISCARTMLSKKSTAALVRFFLDFASIVVCHVVISLCHSI